MMFRSLRTTLLIAFAFVLISPTAAKAELTIAVVDVDYVMSQSSAAKSIKKQVEKKHESFMDKVREEEKKLLADKKEIESKSKEDISREDLMKKMQEYEKKRFEALGYDVQKIESAITTGKYTKEEVYKRLTQFKSLTQFDIKLT